MKAYYRGCVIISHHTQGKSNHAVSKSPEIKEEVIQQKEQPSKPEIQISNLKNKLHQATFSLTKKFACLDSAQRDSSLGHKWTEHTLQSEKGKIHEFLLSV